MILRRTGRAVQAYFLFTITPNSPVRPAQKCWLSDSDAKLGEETAFLLRLVSEVAKLLYALQDLGKRVEAFLQEAKALRWSQEIHRQPSMSLLYVTKYKIEIRCVVTVPTL
jgi:hypothetical protein